MKFPCFFPILCVFSSSFPFIFCEIFLSMDVPRGKILGYLSIFFEYVEVGYNEFC